MKQLLIPLKSIPEEKADCIAAFEQYPSSLAWNCHHIIPAEYVDGIEGAKERILYILFDKLESEQALRLRNFRPVRVELPAAYLKAEADCREESTVDCNNAVLTAYLKARAVWDEVTVDHREELMRLHDLDWPDNSWDGVSIFENHRI